MFIIHMDFYTIFLYHTLSDFIKETTQVNHIWLISYSTKANIFIDETINLFYFHYLKLNKL